MRRWAFLILVFALAGPGCSFEPSGRYGPGYQGNYPGGPGYSGPSGRASQRVAILLPLTGPRAEVGQVLLQAARLALRAPPSPELDPIDTGGTGPGAAAAVSDAVARGDGLIIGPLTSAETASAAPAARQAGIPVLAFTNDPSQAQPGVWTLGITPSEQVQRLVRTALAQGRAHMAALLPSTDFGHVMEAALRAAAQANGLSEPIVKYHSRGMAAITAGVKDLSDYANRRGPVDAKIKELRAAGTPDARREAAQAAKTPIPPPPFDLLLLAETGDDLQEIAAVLPYYDVDRSAVQIIGPALWADPSSGSGAVPGAWYAAPDNSLRATFVNDYTSAYGSGAPAIADLAYDAGLITKYITGPGGVNTGALTQPTGFVGADGWIILRPDGQVRRGLAVFRIERGGPAMIDPPPEPSAAAGL